MVKVNETKKDLLLNSIRIIPPNLIEKLSDMWISHMKMKMCEF